MLADVNQLHRFGYEKAGRWDLSQICNHLEYFIRGSLKGFPFRGWWLIRWLLGPMLLKMILRRRGMMPGLPTPQRPLPEPGDEVEAVERFKEIVRSFESHEGDMQPSPIFGKMTKEQWRELHVIHCAHHLSFLIPKDEGKTD